MSNPKAMNRIKTWRERCNEHPDHNGIVSDGMIQQRMQEEIDELRAALEQSQPPDMSAFAQRLRSDPALAQQFFQSAGILGEDGELTPEYRKQLTDRWVGLTPEEVKEISLANRPYVIDMVRALEQRLKEKNT
jgi:hypothetical protein